MTPELTSDQARGVTRVHLRRSLKHDFTHGRAWRKDDLRVQQRPLNRLQSVTFDTTGFGDTANPILPAATISYQYRTKSTGSELKDVTQMSGVTVAGVSTESFSFDTEGRVSSRTLTLNSRSSYPFVTDYIYDALERITDVRYPAEYGNGARDGSSFIITSTSPAV